MPIDRATFEQGAKQSSIENEVIHFLHEHHDHAYNVHEITVEVMKPGWSETLGDPPPGLEAYVSCILNVATIHTILDQLVDDGAVERRIITRDHEGDRSYYRAP